MQNAVFWFIAFFNSLTFPSSLFAMPITTLANNDAWSFWQPLLAAIMGVILVSSGLFFFIKRSISQYDKKLLDHDKEIESIKLNILDVRNNISEKLYKQSNKLNMTVGERTESIISNLQVIKDNLQKLSTDVAILKEDRNNCKYIRENRDNLLIEITTLKTQVKNILQKNIWLLIIYRRNSSK